MSSTKEIFLEKNGLKEEGWDVRYDGVVECPCGTELENCENGHISPFP